MSVRLPFIAHPVICGECGEMLFSPFRRGRELIYYHSTAQEMAQRGSTYLCNNVGKKYRVIKRPVELEEVHE